MSSRSPSTDTADRSAGTPPADASRPVRHARIPVRDITIIALLAALIVIAKWALRLPISVSGHGGVLWIAVLVVGRGLLKRRWAGTVIGAMAGLLVVVAVPASDGVLNFLKYFAAGVTIDLCALAFRDKFTQVPYAIVSGALAHLAKLSASVVGGIALGIPATMLVAGLGVDAVLHAAFGALGGLLGALTLRALERAGVRPRETAPAFTGGASD